TSHNRGHPATGVPAKRPGISGPGRVLLTESKSEYEIRHRRPSRADRLVEAARCSAHNQRVAKAIAGTSRTGSPARRAAAVNAGRRRRTSSGTRTYRTGPGCRETGGAIVLRAIGERHEESHARPTSIALVDEETAGNGRFADTMCHCR